MDENNQNNPSLISRLIEKLGNLAHKSGSGKMLKTLLALITSATIATSLSACNLINGGGASQDPDSSVSDSTDKNDSNTEENNTSSDTSSSTSKDYSDIFNTILTSSYYLTANERMNTNKTVDEDSYSSLSQKYKEIPYGFSDSDFDAQNIYNDNLECVSIPYFISGDNNTLYLSVRAEHTNDSNQKYYTCYILKYNITDKEYDELTELYSGNTLLAPFYIQELSKQKTATVVNKVKLTAFTYENMLKYLKNNEDLSTSVFGSSNVEFDFTYFTPQETDHDDQYMEMIVRSSSSPVKISSSKASFINDGEMRPLTVFPSMLGAVKTVNDGNVIYSSPYDNFNYSIDDYQSDANATSITYYYTRSGVNLKTYDVSNYLNSLN